jgi:uncharacterized SAM-binding protein YcdF (DUF218 family)
MSDRLTDLLERTPVSQDAGAPASNVRRFWTCSLAILLIVAGACAWAILRAGAWLVVQDPLGPAQAIVVLSGRMPGRAMEAARLYRQNVAPEVWVSQPVSPRELLQEMSIPFVGEDYYSQRVLIAMGVPADAVRIMPEPSANTAAEVEQIARLAREGERASQPVVIVTSAAHTRRVRAIWNRRVGDALPLIVRHAEDDPFDAAHWWRNTQDALDVLREWAGLANALMGFPAQPYAN